jgi:alpha-L-fucosidase 2
VDKSFYLEEIFCCTASAVSISLTFKQTTAFNDHENKQGRVKFESRLLPVLAGGSLEFNENTAEVSAADTLTLYLSMATNFRNYKHLDKDPSALNQQRIHAVQGKTFDAVQQQHQQSYKKLFDRVSLDLGRTVAADLPTDERVKGFKSGEDPHLAALYFQFGRYLLISSSFPETQPANLQGIWNKELFPAWDSKYTVNINTEMNYWPAEPTALPECHQPLFAMLTDLSESGAETAREMYGARGWVLHHNTDLWRITGKTLEPGCQFLPQIGKRAQIGCNFLANIFLIPGTQSSG